MKKRDTPPAPTRDEIELAATHHAIHRRLVELTDSDEARWVHSHSHFGFVIYKGFVRGQWIEVRWYQLDKSESVLWNGVSTEFVSPGKLRDAIMRQHARESHVTALSLLDLLNGANP